MNTQASYTVRERLFHSESWNSVVTDSVPLTSFPLTVLIVSRTSAECHSMGIDRNLNIAEVLQGKSCFLFGPRQTGKSTLIRLQLDGYPLYDLLDQSLFLRLSRNPSLIRQSLEPETSLVIIDEIQKMPELLNEIQLMIEGKIGSWDQDVDNPGSIDIGE